LFGVAASGPFGGVGWTTGYESVQHFEDAEGALMTDPEWLALLDREAATAYCESAFASEQLVWRLVG
jgi:hypothetical protein